METVEDITKFMQLLVSMSALVGMVCGCILWAIKLCVERLLMEIKTEISGIKLIISNHTTVHDEHKNFITHLEEHVSNHEVRIVHLENKKKKG